MRKAGPRTYVFIGFFRVKKCVLYLTKAFACGIVILLQSLFIFERACYASNASKEKIEYPDLSNGSE